MVKVIVSSRKSYNIFDLLNRYEPHEIVPSHDDNRQDISEYMENKFREKPLRIKLPKDAFVLVAIKKEALLKSEGNFLYIKQLILAIETGQIDVNDISTFPDGLVGIYVNYFNRLFSGKRDYDDFRSILEIITCMKVPFSAKDLAPIIGLPEFEIRKRIRILSAFFSERNGRYSPYHKSITDWLTGDVGEGDVYLLDMGRAKQRVCDYLLDRYYKEDYDPYLIDYLPTHLIEGEMYEELTKVLVDFNFLIQKCKQGQVYELIRDIMLLLMFFLKLAKPDRRKRNTWTRCSVTPIN